MQAAVIIPVYNHGPKLGDVLRRTIALGLPVFVVDDGSTDSTGAIAAAFDVVTLFRHRSNLGKGAAILTGMQAALEHGCNVVVTMDGDGQHDPADARALLAAAGDDRRCLVIGRRHNMDEERHVPWTSRFGRGFSNFWVWASGGPWVSDSQSGFRLYPIPEVLQLGVKSRRYQFEVEVLVRARVQGIEIREAPVSVVYQAKGERVSHFRPWLDFHRNSAVFCRLIFARIFRMFGL